MQYVQKLFVYHPREQVLLQAINHTKKYLEEGDYFEFGVFRGETTVKAFHWLQSSKKSRDTHLHLFDSFEGMPKNNEGNEFFKGCLACSLEEFKKIIPISDKIHIYKGWFKDLKLKLKNKAKLIYIDCDLYESTVDVLNFCIPLIQDGTIIIFDDWYCFNADSNKGEQKAFREWLEKTQFKAQEFQNVGGLLKSFIIRNSYSIKKHPSKNPNGVQG